MTHDNALPPSPRKRKRWRWLLLGALLILLMIATPFGVWWYMRWSAYAEVQAVIADLDKTDPNWRLSDILQSRQSLPDEENGALVVIAAHKLMPANWGDSFGIGPDSFFDLPPPVRLSAKQFHELRAELNKTPEALAKALKVGRFSSGEYPVHYTQDWFSTNLSDIQNARQVAYLLQVNAYVCAHDKKTAQAWNSAIAGYRVSTSIGNTDTLLTHLVRISTRAIALHNVERVLGQTEVSEASLAKFQRMIEEDFNAPILHNAIRGERAGSHQIFTALADGKLNVRPLLALAKKQPFVEEVFTELTLKSQIPRAHACTLKFMTKSLAAADNPPEIANKKFAELDAEIKKDAGGKNFPLLAKSLLPPTSKIGRADIRVRTSMQCAIVGLACERFRLAHNRFPKDLPELVKGGYIAKIPIDPYDGKPLRYRTSNSGVVVYSIRPSGYQGFDEKYDGSLLDNVNEESTENLPDVHWHFRVYHPIKRRLPPWLPKLNRN